MSSLPLFSSSPDPAPAAAPFVFTSAFSFGNDVGGGTVAPPSFTTGFSFTPSQNDDDKVASTASASSNSNSRTSFGLSSLHSRDNNSRVNQSIASKHNNDDNKEDDDLEEGEIDDDEDNEDDDNEDDDNEDDDNQNDDDQRDDDDEGETEYVYHESSSLTVECEQCGDHILISDINHHMTRVCSDTPLSCPFASYNCGSTATNRRLLRAHVSRNPEDHVVWLMAQASEQAKQIASLTATLKGEVAKRERIERALETLMGKSLAPLNPLDSEPYAHGGSSGGARRGIMTSGGSNGRNHKSNQHNNNGGGQSGQSHRVHHSVTFSPTHSSTESPSPSTKFSISFDSSSLMKPLSIGENRWTPHSLPTSAESFSSSSSSIGPVTSTIRSMAGTANAKSDEMTRLKVAAGLLPASALQLLSPSKSSPSPSPPPPTSSPSPSSSSPLFSSSASPGPSSSPPASSASAARDLPTLSKQLKSTLNKLTAANFAKLSGQVVSILTRAIDNEAHLSSLCILIFDKAVIDSYFANIYAMLCATCNVELTIVQNAMAAKQDASSPVDPSSSSSSSPSPSPSPPARTFNKYLLSQCQSEFTAGTSVLTLRLASTDGGSADNESAESFANRQSLQKKRLMGTILFIGELYKKDLVVEPIMTFCITHLMPALDWKTTINADGSIDDDEKHAAAADDDGASISSSSSYHDQSSALDSFCKLLHTIGAKLDKSVTGKKMLDNIVFPKIIALAKARPDASSSASSVASPSSSSPDVDDAHAGGMPNRYRFMLLDLADLRSKSKWVPRSKAAQTVATAVKQPTTVEMGVGSGSGNHHGNDNNRGGGRGGDQMRGDNRGGDNRGDNRGNSNNNTPSRVSSGRGAVHTNDQGSSAFASPPPRSTSAPLLPFPSSGSSSSSSSSNPNHVHHDNHAHNSMANQQSSSSKSRRSGGGNSNNNNNNRSNRRDDDRYDDEQDYRGSGGNGGGGGQWHRGDRVEDQRDGGGGSRRKSGGGGGNNRR